MESLDLKIAELSSDYVCGKLLAKMQHVPEEYKALLPVEDKLRSLMYVGFLDAYEFYADPRSDETKKELSVLRMATLKDQERSKNTPYLERMEELWRKLDPSFVKILFDSQRR